MVVDQQYVDAWFYVAVLEGIVKKYDVNGVVLGQLGYAPSAVLVDGNGDAGELLLHLVGLIANLLHGRVLVGQHVTTALALVASAQYGHFKLVFQQLDEVFNVGRLACASNGDVAYGDDGYLIILALQDSHVEEEIPEAYPYAVEPA